MSHLLTLAARNRSEARAKACADARPRIHIWTDRDLYRWSSGPCGARSSLYRSPGQALDAAVDSIGLQNTVVFVEVGHG